MDGNLCWTWTPLPSSSMDSRRSLSRTSPELALTSTRATSTLTVVPGVRKISPRWSGFGVVNGHPHTTHPLSTVGFPVLTDDWALSDRYPERAGCLTQLGFLVRSPCYPCPPGPRLDLCFGAREPMGQKPSERPETPPDPKPTTTPRGAGGDAGNLLNGAVCTLAFAPCSGSCRRFRMDCSVMGGASFDSASGCV